MNDTSFCYRSLFALTRSSTCYLLLVKHRKKGKKRKLLKSSISKSLLSSGFKHILLPMRIVSLYQSNGLYFDVDALHPSLVLRQQRFQGFQIIAPNDHVFAAIIFVVLSVFIKGGCGDLPRDAHL